MSAAPGASILRCGETQRRDRRSSLAGVTHSEPAAYLADAGSVLSGAMADLLTCTIDEGIATITLDDGKANAISPTLLAEINAALDQAEAAKATVLIAGRAGRFSGGFDLKILTAGGDTTIDLLRGGFELSHRLLSFPTGVVIACTGHAMAMGVFLLLSGDHRVGIAGGGHRICANEVAIGMTMPKAAIEVCKQRLTPAALQQAVVLAADFTHDSAVAAGILDEVVPADELMTAARAAAARLHSLHAGALKGTKLRLRAESLAALATAIDDDGAELRTAMS